MHQLRLWLPREAGRDGKLWEQLIRQTEAKSGPRSPKLPSSPFRKGHPFHCFRIRQAEVAEHEMQCSFVVGTPARIADPELPFRTLCARDTSRAQRGERETVPSTSYDNRLTMHLRREAAHGAEFCPVHSDG